MTSAKEIERFNSDNFIPDAARMLENRKGGITLDESCLELIDNAEDAGSSETTIYLEPDKNKNLAGFWILDNGKGMNSDELINAVKFPGKDMNRANGSIGTFHMGYNNATIGMGNDSYLVTKQRNNEYRAIHMNIKNMQNLNTFAPTAYWNDEKTITNNIYNKRIWDKFKKYESGTLIYVKNIHPHISTNIEKVLNTLKKNIPMNYTNLKANLYITTTSEDKITKPISLKTQDEFYNNSPEKIEVCYETTLLYYPDKKLIEVLESTRARGKDMINATKKDPKYYMFKQCEGKNVRLPFNNNHIQLEKNSEELKKYLSQKPLGTMLIKYVSVTSEAYSAETDGEGESIRRNGVSIMRDNRVVSRANLLGMNLDDHYNRSRMSVTYSPELDLELGCTTQKQINNVNSPEIRDALMMIFRQCAANIIKQQKDANSAKKNSKEQQKSSNKDEVSNKEDEVSNKEGEVSNKEGEVSSNKEVEVSNKEGEVSNKDDEVSNKDDEVSNKECEVSNKDDEVSNEEDEVSNNDDEVSNKDDEVSNKEDEVSNKDDEVSNKEGEVSNKEDEVSNKEDEVSIKDDEASIKDDEVSIKDDEASNKDDEVSNNDDEVSKKEDEVSKKEDEVSIKDDEVSIKDDEVSNKDDEVSNKDDEASNKEDKKDIRQKKVSAYVSGTISGVQLKELSEIINKEIDCNKNYVDDYVKFYNLGKRLFSPNL